MARGFSRRTRVVICVALLAGGLVAGSLRTAAQQPPAAPAAGGQVDPSAELYAPQFKFLGASTCADSNCHGGTERVKNPGAPYKDHSFTTWNKEATADAPADPHRTSYKSLQNDAGKKIAAAMGIANAHTDAHCMSCHTLNPPENLRDKTFRVAEGVTCNACHGPAGPSVTLQPTDPAAKGWNETHREIGFLAKTRAALSHGDMLKKHGLYNTTPLFQRAQQCVSCHLAIDAKMVAAGHPQPTFEMNWFSLTYANRHWDDPAADYFGARLWASGQAASLQAALKQLADRAAGGAPAAELTSAYMQALGHYTVFSSLFPASGIAGNLTDIAAAMTTASKSLAPDKHADLAKAAHTASDAAGKLGAPAEAWKPTEATATAVLKALLASTDAAAGLKDFGIEQHRDALFAVYNAHASSVPEAAKAAAEEKRDFIGQTLFPLDEAGQPKPAKAITPEQYKALVAQVKTKLGM